MTQKKTTKVFMRMSIIALICGVFAGCAEKNLYDPNWNKNKLPPEESYFGYEMRADVKLSINYNAPGFQTIIEVYDQNPMQDDGIKKTDLKPIYSAYINDGKLEGKMYVPTTFKEAYLYTDNWSLPQCIKMELTKEGIVYDATKASVSSRATLRKGTTGDKVPYKVAGPSGGDRSSDVLYSLCQWDVNGMPNNNGYLTETTEIKKEAADISTRVMAEFDRTEKKSEFLRDANITNINVTEDETTLDVVLLAERAAYDNTFGYYYYNTEKAPAEKDLHMYAKKYIIFPRATIEPFADPRFPALKCGSAVSLLFFGEDGKEAPTKNFPKGYTIGWFFISDGYDYFNETIIDDADNFNFYSNNTSEKRRFVSLNDKKTGTVVLGFEDQVKPVASNEDYSDVLFYVKSNKDINKEDRPEIPDGKPEPAPGHYTIEGTLAFEDIWPSGGDYDMNDVVVEYKRTFEFDSKNNATKVTETFKPVHDGAELNNFFAYQMKHKTTVTPQQGVVYESGTNSIIINSSIKEIQKKEYTIERTFDATTNKDEAVKDFNPFIIVDGYTIDAQNRKEVHLPKQLPTAYADQTLNYTENDAYYVQKDGKYPFAIDIPIVGFNVAAETFRIDAESEYPAFRTWADSKGEKAPEWYLKK